jgi:DNA polymerase-1
MIDVDAALRSWNRGRPAPARMILTVHDELLFEAPDGDVEAVSDLIRQAMEHAFPLAVPLTVDLGSGRNWKAAKP